MPQGQRTAGEKVRFSWMLQNVNLLYLGAKVLVLVDLSYVSRLYSLANRTATLTTTPVRPARPDAC